MKVEIRANLLKAFMTESKAEDQCLADAVEHVWQEDRKLDVQLDELSDKTLEKLQAWISTPSRKDASTLGIARKISYYINVKANPTGTKVKMLEGLATALKTYIARSPHKWLFTETSDDQVLPYYVSDIRHKPGESDSPAQTSVTLRAVCRGSGEDDGITWYAKDLGSTVVELLQKKGYFLETPEACSTYAEEIKRYDQLHELTGHQFCASGYAFPTNEWRYTSEYVSMERDGMKSKVVMDDLNQEDDPNERHRNHNLTRTVSSSFWNRSNSGEDDDGTSAPVHPYVMVFDLVKHQHVKIHVNNLEPYQYDDTMATKLVLPESTKDIIQILIQGSADHMDDIVKGKTGGTIIIATGPPGTGKTLTAEVFSEAVKVPLYLVQCSQLGTDEEKLEKELSKVLARASRWKAILLIDEADVYVHSRGNDIRQNAIVGVFLRVLEYYQGILFMTSNRSTIIDDAIMSRATAWIRYQNPTPEEQRRIWTVLSRQFQIDLSPSLIRDLVANFRGISGRNVKNLLKLALPMSLAKKTPITLDLMKQVSTFLDLESHHAEGSADLP
jgi:hypothetical protein